MGAIGNTFRIRYSEQNSSAGNPPCGQGKEVYMHEQGETVQNTEKMWYVMVHLSPQWIETMLHREKQGELMDREQPETPARAEDFDFFVPFQFMRPDTTDDVRSIFHNFVFISASAERLRAILASNWNTMSRLHLRHYRNKSGAPIMITDEEYQQLRATFMNRQLKMFFGTPVDTIGEMVVGDRVILLIDGWKGKQGKIQRVSLKKGRVHMVVAVDILGHTKSVNFEDLHDGDVIFADHATQQLLTGNLISNIESQLVTILGHYYQKNAAEKMRRDYPRLNRLMAYANVQVDDEDDRKRFTALMLICATLLNEEDAIARYTTQVQQWLSAPNSQFSLSDSQFSISDFTSAYLSVALFVATRDPRLRDAAKAYRKTHPDSAPILGTLINKIRDAHAVKSHTYLQV